MKIARIAVHRTGPPCVGGVHGWGRGNVIPDANQGWRVDEALRVATATRWLDSILEQPCRTSEKRRLVRRRCDLPMKLDGCVAGIHAAQRIVADRGAEIRCLKISNPGGLTKARRARDHLVETRISVVAEDTRGGETASAAVAHFAAPTPEIWLTDTTGLHNHNTGSTGRPAPATRDGRLHAPDAPGLGLEPDFDALGPPVADYGD